MNLVMVFWSPCIRKPSRLALNAKGLRVFRKIEVPVWFRGHQVGEFEADILVEEVSLTGVEGSSRPRLGT